MDRWRLTATHNIYGEHSIIEDADPDGEWVKYEDADALKAETARLAREALAIDGQLHDALARVANAEADREALRVALTEAGEDTDRLDFLDRCNERLNTHYGTTYRWELILNHNVNRLMLGPIDVDLNDAKAHGLPSCRDAIDGEMKRVAAARALTQGGGDKGEGQ
jgi:hypothetical protein